MIGISRFPPAVLAAAVAIVVYAPSLAGGFLYDDIPILVDNRRIQDIANLGAILRYEPARPLLGLTWALNYAVAGTTAWPYHLVNILIHAANAALLASLFAWLARRSDGRITMGAATFAACFFAATPMAAETVAYVASRSSALSTLFSLAALRLALPALANGRRTRRWWLALGFFVLALLTKEEAACVPLVLLFADRFFVDGMSRARLALHAPFWMIPAIGLVARRAATGEWLPEAVIPRGVYALTQLAAFPGYLLRAVVPFDPAFFRGHAPASWPPSAATTIYAMVGIALLALAAWGLRRRALYALAILWMAAALVPSSTLVPLREMVVDHRAYFGGVGVALALGVVLWTPERRYFAAVVLVLMAARSWHYQHVLADPVRAWQDAVRHAPNSGDAWRALAEAYGQRGDPRAESALRRSMAEAPRDARGWANLGVAYAQSGRWAEATAALQSAIRVDPADARLHDNLGLVLEAQGRFNEAAAAYEGAIGASPPLAQPRIRLASILAARGETGRARALLDEAARLEIDPEAARAIEEIRQRLP
jgi:Flp pilus assembly protein TadD